MVKLYKRNLDQLRKIPGMTVKGRLAELTVRCYKLQFAELGYKQDIAAHNVEVLLWKLNNTRKPNGQHYLITHEYQGVVDNLSFERLFGEIIVLQEMMAGIADDSTNRVVTGAVHAVPGVFIPLPIQLSGLPAR